MTSISKERVGTLLTQRGLRRQKVGRMPSFWTRNRADVSPFFSPALVRRRDGYQLLGVVGVILFSFEDWWAEVLTRAPPDDGAADGFLLGVYLTNFPELIDPPLLNDRSLEPWLDRVSSKMDEMPTSIAELSDAATMGELAGLGFPLYRGHAVKVAAAKGWMIARSLPDLFPGANRIADPSPYTAAYRELFPDH